MYFPEGLENTPFILAALGGVPPLVTISRSLIVFNPVRGHKRAPTVQEMKTSSLNQTWHSDKNKT